MLVPKKVVIGASCKAYGFRDGLSTGTELSVEYEVPEGTSPKDFKMLVIREKLSLDSLAAALEAGKGSLPSELYADMKARIEKFKERVLREQGED